MKQFGMHHDQDIRSGLKRHFFSNHPLSSSTGQIAEINHGREAIMMKHVKAVSWLMGNFNAVYFPN